MTIAIESKIENTILITAIQTSEYKNYLTNTDDAIRTWLAATDFRANPHTHALLPDASGRIAQVLVGVRDADDIYAFSHLPLALPPGRYTIIGNDNASLSWQLGSYQFTRYKKAKREPATLVVASSPAVEKSQMIYATVKLVRDLVNTPTEDMGPQHLSEVAQSLAKEFGATFNEWVGEDLLKHNFPAIHAVGRASHRPPRLIELTWGDAKHPRIAIVGKGVCFDTGGVNLKGADGMRWMKKDMGGGAHALALARLIMAAKLPVHLHMLVPAVENAVSGNAYRPGEVVATRVGHTIEIGNTDAEGRVILCDALAYGAEGKPLLMIDMATLTGAARVALGPQLPALFCRSMSLARELVDSGLELQDPLWHLPLWAPYHAGIESDIADIVNTGKGPQGGAINAALFLEDFVPAELDWLHLDIYASNDGNRPGRPAGGEAQGVRTLLAYLEKRFAPTAPLATD